METIILQVIAMEEVTLTNTRGGRMARDALESMGQYLDPIVAYVCDNIGHTKKRNAPIATPVYRPWNGFNINEN